MSKRLTQRRTTLPLLESRSHVRWFNLRGTHGPVARFAKMVNHRPPFVSLWDNGHGLYAVIC